MRGVLMKTLPSEYQSPTQKATINSSGLLTLEDISPRWASRFKELPLPLFSLKNIGWSFQILSAELCVVGEAYGYSGSYVNKCEKCTELGHEFVTSFITHSYNSLEKTKKTFVEHWNEQHSDITRKRRRASKQKLLEPPVTR